MKEIAGVPILDLVRDYGSPLYVVNEEKLKESYRAIRDAFTKRYLPVSICYSYKTNYLLPVCHIFRDLGAGAEVVSEFELEIAKNLGFNASKLVFNGPYKAQQALREAVELGACINVDNVDEIIRLERIGETIDRTIKIGVRVNVTTKESWRKFGFNIDSGEAIATCKRIKTEFGHLEIVGFHSHIGTDIADIKYYGYTTKKVIGFIKKATNQFGLSLEYIDLGGGFPTSQACPSQYGFSKWHAPAIDTYAQIICDELEHAFPTKPLLVLEPGRYLVDDAFILLTRVCSIKEIEGAKSLIVDAGTNVSPTFFNMTHKVDWCLQDPNKPETTVDIYGPLCMQADILETGVRMPDPGVGDILIFKSIGAYSLSRSTQFIGLRPAVVNVFDGKTELFRQREATEDILRLDKVPQRLLNRSAETASINCERAPKKGILIREASPKDLDKIYDLMKTIPELKLIIEEKREPFTSKEYIEEYIKDKDRSLVLVAEDHGKILGAILAEMWINKKYSFLSNIFVEPEFRGNGVGNELYNYYYQHCKNMGIEILIAFTQYDNERAQDMFRRLGFGGEVPFKYFWRGI